MSRKIVDPENPEWTKKDFAQAVGPEALSAAELAAFPRTAKMGRPKLESPKKQITLRLDQMVIDRFRALGPGWQAVMNDVLASAVLPDVKK